MLCNKCKKNQATVYYRQNINGKKSEQMLCRSCFEEMQANAQASDFDSLLGSLFSPILPHALQDNSVKMCDLCGSTWNEICEAGKVGCARCYEVFERELQDTLHSVHGRVSHMGRSPKTQLRAEKKEQKKEEKQAEKEERTALRSLKQQLKDAIAEERFEDAARLRDQIKEAEQNGGDNQ